MDQQTGPDHFLRTIVHVERLHEESKVNRALSTGWTLLETATDRDGVATYVIGWSSSKGEMQKPKWMADRDEDHARVNAAAAAHQRRKREELGI